MCKPVALLSASTARREKRGVVQIQSKEKTREARGERGRERGRERERKRERERAWDARMMERDVRDEAWVKRRRARYGRGGGDRKRAG
eukprot:3218087-Rhodomonas_salina.1